MRHSAQKPGLSGAALRSAGAVAESDHRLPGHEEVRSYFFFFYGKIDIDCVIQLSEEKKPPGLLDAIFRRGPQHRNAQSADNFSNKPTLGRYLSARWTAAGAKLGIIR